MNSNSATNELEHRFFKNHQSKWEQTIFSDFLKNESEWMKRAKVELLEPTLVMDLDENLDANGFIQSNIMSNML